MHFCIDADAGDCVRGWVVPNNPSSIPKIIVVRPGQAELVVEANVMRTGIRDMGLHETGQVGFAVGADLIPEIVDLKDFYLLEFDSRIPIFHRNRTHHTLAHKLCVFDTSVTANSLFQSTISAHFNLAYFATESIPLETMMFIVNNKFTDSIFIHGRPSVFRYNEMLRGVGFKTAALLTAPFVDLAARLMCLNIVSRDPNADMKSQGLHGLGCLIPLAQALPFDNPKGMAATFRDATPEQLQAVSDPMTRLFACEPNEDALRRHVSLALENLATMDLVSTRGRFGIFSKTLQGLIGEDIFDGQTFPMLPSIHEIAKSLAQIKLLNELLENDVTLYHWAEQAIELGAKISES